MSGAPQPQIPELASVDVFASHRIASHRVASHGKGECHIRLGLFMIQDYMEDMIKLMSDIAETHEHNGMFVSGTDKEMLVKVIWRSSRNAFTRVTYNVERYYNTERKTWNSSPYSTPEELPMWFAFCYALWTHWCRDKMAAIFQTTF